MSVPLTTTIFEVLDGVGEHLSWDPDEGTASDRARLAGGMVIAYTATASNPVEIENYGSEESK